MLSVELAGYPLRMIFLIIIIVSLGQIVLSYSAHHITHTRTHTHTAVAVQVVAVRCVGGAPFRWFPWRSMAGRWFIQINTRAGDIISSRFLVFFAYKKMLGRIETRTRDRKHFQSIRTVSDTSRDDRASIATCSLLTPTEMFKENYRVDNVYLRAYKSYFNRVLVMHVNHGMYHISVTTWQSEKPPFRHDDIHSAAAYQDRVCNEARQLQNSHRSEPTKAHRSIQPDGKRTCQIARASNGRQYPPRGFPVQLRWQFHREDGDADQHSNAGDVT